MPTAVVSPPAPEVHHGALQTTFFGVEHPISRSKKDAPSGPLPVVHQYRGIKYASVPQRFRQSRLWTTYPTMTDATRFGPICPQPQGSFGQTFDESLFSTDPAAAVMADYLDAYKQPFKQNEFECLNLNITVPAYAESLPVMVWLHGGSDRGSGSSWVTDAGAFVRHSIIIGRPVIVVTLNFRLGLFGFAASQALRDDNKAHGEDGVGNYGLKDQRVALEWLQYFIADFGGDPKNVTLMGSGTGAADVVAHYLSAANARGNGPVDIHQSVQGMHGISAPLFRRAIVQSAILDTNVPSVSEAGSRISKVLSALGIHSSFGPGAHKSVDDLRAVPADILATFGQALRVVDDGRWWRSDWREFFKPESKHHAHFLPHHAPPGRLQPLIIGDCAGDALLWSKQASSWNAPAVVRRLKAVCQSMTRSMALMRAYDISQATDDQEYLEERVLDLIQDARVSWPTECLARAVANHGTGLWRYVFDQESPRACVPHHGVDLAYLFDNVLLPDGVDGMDLDVFPDSFSDDESDFEESVPSHGQKREVTFEEVDFEARFQASMRPDTLVRSYSHDSTMTASDVSMTSSASIWSGPSVSQCTYSKVRETMQEKWLAFAYGEKPWLEQEKGGIFVFGPEGETGQRSAHIFAGRRRKELWRQAFEPMGMQMVHKIGMEMSRGPVQHGGGCPAVAFV